jgi:para-nitrobenzyl esterase
MADTMAGAFAAFAKTGNPTTPELPWEPYNSSARATMIFDLQSGVKK